MPHNLVLARRTGIPQRILHSFVARGAGRLTLDATMPYRPQRASWPDPLYSRAGARCCCFHPKLTQTRTRNMIIRTAVTTPLNRTALFRLFGIDQKTPRF